MSATLASMPRRTKDETEPVRMSKSLAKKAGLIARWLDMSVPDYLSERFSAQIEKEFAAVVEQMRKSKSEK